MENFYTKRFSESLRQSNIQKRLQLGAIAGDDTKSRIAAYSGMFKNLQENLELARKVYSNEIGYGNLSLGATSQFDATVIANLSSFAAYTCIERALDNPNDIVSFLDLTGAYSNNIVDPNLGPYDMDGINNVYSADGNLTAATAVDLVANNLLIPGSVKLTLNITNAGSPSPVVGTYEVKDDSHGNLVAAPGVLTAGTVNYKTGTISFTSAGAGTYALRANFDATAPANNTGNNVVTYKQGSILMNTYPHLLMALDNLANIAAMGKTLGVNPQEYLTKELANLYVQRINQMIVAEVKAGDTSDPVEIDLSKQAFTDFTAYADYFTAQFVGIDYEIAQHAYKATRATCYLVAPDVAAKMTQTQIRGNFVQSADYNYINDMVGLFRGVPVLQHVDIPAGTGYALNKFPKGEVGPLCRGLFLPLTSTPYVGNYNNPTQISQGVYWQDAVKMIFPELVQKFTVKGELGGN